MTLYSRLEDIPLPKKIYNAPLEKHIIPLVRAVTVQGLTTIGSCEGHINQGTPYPWVQFFPTDNPRLLEFLVSAYNSRNYEIPWCLEGNCVRTKQNARTTKELSKLQTSSDKLAQFLFQYRLEVLDSTYEKNIIRIPNTTDPRYKQIILAIDRLYDYLCRILKQKIANPLDKKLNKKFEKTYQSKLKKLEELEKKEFAMREILELPITEEQANNWLQKAKIILGS